MQSPRLAPTALRRVALLFAALVAALTLAPVASAAKLTFSVGAGAQVTLSDTANPADAAPGDAFPQGSKVYLTGTGFTGTGGTGFPQVCIKLNDVDGELTYDNNTTAFETNLPTFQTDAAGAWSGWVQLKNDVPLTGPGSGANAGKHWLRVLSGVPSSGTNVTVPISYQAYFRVQSDLEAGFTNTAGTYFPGSTISQGPFGAPVPNTSTPALPAGPAYTVVGAAGKLDPSESVAVTLDGAPLTANTAGTSTALTTNVDGSFRAWTNLPVTTAGDHTLRVATSTKNEEITLKTVIHSAALQTPKVRPGGTAVVSIAGFLGIDGKPQKVALVGRGPSAVGTVTDDAVLGCGETDATGAATLTATIHTTAAAGPGILRVAAGTNCVPPLVSQPLPRFIPSVGLTVDVAAPQAGTTFTKGSVGLAFPIAGSGYGAGESVQPKIDGANAGSPLVAGASGELAGNVTLPAGATLGRKVLTFVGATSTLAADTIEAIAAPKVTINNSGLASAQTLKFTLKGFVRGFAREDASWGQKVALRLDAGRDIIGCVSTDNDGNADGELALPAGLADGEHTLQVLAGSACVSGGSGDAPSRSVPTKFEVVNPRPAVVIPDGTAPAPAPAPTPTPAGPAGQRPSSLKPSGSSKLRLSLDAGMATKVVVSVKTKSKTTASGRGKKKIVTVVKSTTVRPVAGKARTVTLRLTADGKKLLRRLKSIKVVITVDPDGTGATTTRTITLRR